jgi:hypothetical protein
MSKDAITLWTGGGLVAAGAVVSALATNFLGAMRDRRRYKHEQDLARAAQRHEQETARETRRQERLTQTYLELLTYLSHYLDWAKSVRPMWGPVPAPDPVPSQERWRIEALVTAYGSPEVLRLLRLWGEHAAKIDNADATIRLLEQSKNPSQQFDEQAMQEHRALPTYKQEMFRADEAIRDMVRRELAGET